jgi:hypothetical protein
MNITGNMDRTMRAGFLGAFPGDGTTHPIIKNLALELERRMPKVSRVDADIVLY